jgi:long-subunit fatty acid transport protein
MNIFKKAGTALILVSASACVSAGELPNSENMQGLQFNFSNPGARSLGMGGAFVGRADDATAAFANPAGLTTLFSPEISGEYRNTKYSTGYTTGGSYPDSIESGTAKNSVNNLSYLSYVHPFEKFVIAVYRHELMNFETDFTTGSIDLNPGETFPTANGIDTNIASYGLSAAYRISERFSLGASFVYYDYSMDAYTDRFDDAFLESTQTLDGNDNSWGVTLGAIFSITDRLNLGLVYRSTPKFDTTYEIFDFDDELGFSRNFDFEVPDAYGAGLSFQATENLTLNFDVVRIEYADLASPIFDQFDFDAPVSEPALGGKLRIDSGTELHFGAEFILPNAPVALRAGVWTDPEHTIYYKGTVDGGYEKFNDAIFQGSDDETHFSLGVGFFFGTKGQIDLAADFADSQDVYSISGVFRFD